MAVHTSPQGTTGQPLSPNTVVQTQTSDQTVSTAYRYIAAWTLVLIALFLLTKSRLGYAAVYYTLLLAIVLLFVTQYQAIASILAPVSQGVPQGNAATGAGGSAGSF